jgi:RNA polymerase sigma factor (sigma-70 family)
VIFRRDPLARTDELIRDVYAYVAYRVPNRSDAEDITSAVFERAVRYRKSYDASKGPPIAWLIGIARGVIADDVTRRRNESPAAIGDVTTSASIEDDVARRLDLTDAVAQLDERSRDLIALRYGVGLTSREIAELEGMEPNAVDVALHRARKRLESLLAEPEAHVAGS